MFFSPFPFLRYTIFFIVGVVLYTHTGIREQWLWWLGICLALSYWIALRVSKNKILLGILGCTLLIMSGYLLALVHTRSFDEDYFTKINHTHYEVIVNGLVEEKANSWKAIAEVQGVSENSKTTKASGEVLLYFDKDDFQKPKYGDVFFVKGPAQAVESPKNPEEFDYKRYLSFQGIYHQQFVRDTNAVFINHTVPNRFIDFTYKLNAYCDSLLTTHIGSRKEYAVANAMILGLRDDLDNDLMQAYSAAGAIHVLSVSGLHVGIIMSVLAIVFGFLKRRGGAYRWLYVGLILSILWFYALLTGLSAPVLRSTLMFSMFLIGETFDLENESYNVVAFSAFCLLLYNPFLCLNVGFQLSYLAVFGMIYFQPMLNPLIKIDKDYNWLYWSADRFWKITTVAVAAQIATLPITIYYFHQFPNYFLLANPFVIVLSTFVLIGGLGFLVFASFLELVGLVEWAGVALKWLIFALNQTVTFTEGLAGAITHFLHLTTTEVWLFYALIGCLCLLKEKLSFRYVSLVILLIVCWLCFMIYQNNQRNAQELLVIHSIPKHTAINIIKGREATLLCDVQLTTDRKNMAFRLTNFWASRGIIDTNKVAFANDNYQAFEWKKKRFLVLRSSLKGKEISSQTVFDYLILANKSARRWEEISQLKFKTLVFDGSFSNFYANRFIVEAQKRKVQYHVIAKAGALVIEPEKDKN
jgi:competence protein ComEC